MNKVTAFFFLSVLCAVGASAGEPLQLDGKALYLKKCGICHLPGEMATNILTRRLGKERGVLAKRDDLTPAFIRGVARGGQLMMPRFSRVEVSDPELSAIAGYLTDPERVGGEK